MKLIQNIFLGLCLLLSFSACQDAYEIEQAGLLDDETTFQTVDDLEAYLNGLYTSGSNLNEILFTTLFTDEAAPPPGYNGEYRDLHRFTLNSASELPPAIWVNNYFTINRVNRMIAGSDLISYEESETAALNDILAQGRFLRANAYMQLLSFFSPDMKNGSELGVIVVEGVPDTNAQLPRSTNAEVYAIIESDLNFALNNLSNSNDYFHVNKAAVEALMARMHAYRGNYGQAETYAQNVINNYGLELTPAEPYSASGFYTPNTTNPYRQIWADVSQGEQIFTLKSETTGTGFAPASLFYFNSTNALGQPKWAMGYNLYLELLELTNDIRAKAFIDPSSNVNLPNVLIDKYPGIPSAPLRNNVKLFRLTEMYYLLAEAATANSNLGMAAEYLHEVMSARTYDSDPAMPSFANSTEAYGAILDERRREYCFEGMRYIDLRRLGALGNRSIDRSDNDDELDGMPLTIDINDHRWTLPIPIAEFSGNPSIQQNPGY